MWEVPKLSPCCCYCCFCFSGCSKVYNSELSIVCRFLHTDIGFLVGSMPRAITTHYKTIKICIIRPFISRNAQDCPLQQKLSDYCQMFRISQKCFPAKHGKAGFPTTPTPFRIGSHIIRIRNHPIVCTSLGGSLGGSACNGFLLIGLMKLILFAKIHLKHQEITLRNQKNKGNAGHKNVRSI